MEQDAKFFGNVKGSINPLGMDIPIPSIMYRNSIASNLVVFYQNVITNYIPRIVARLTKYNVIKWFLALIGIRQEWLLVLLVAIL